MARSGPDDENPCIFPANREPYGRDGFARDWLLSQSSLCFGSFERPGEVRRKGRVSGVCSAAGLTNHGKTTNRETKRDTAGISLSGLETPAKLADVNRRKVATTWD